MGVSRGWRIAAWVVLASAASAVAGPDWAEVNDAGQQLFTAQVPRGTAGSLNTISGVLGGTGVEPDFADCYIIRIVNPSIFSATVTTANFDAQLYLFNISLPGGAYGLLANDDQSPSNNLPRFTNVSTDGTNVIVALPGDYMIGISGTSFHPLAPSGPGGATGRIFNYANLTEVSGPDGPGGFNQLTTWSGQGEFGDYIITLTGCDFPIFPAPGTSGMLGLAGVVMARRRR
jgi:hypothetical protein